MNFSCDEEPVKGCTSAHACNFNPKADKEDGSCLEYDCSGECGGNALPDDCGICNGDNFYNSNEIIEGIKWLQISNDTVR